jgi:hypothetical protein
MAGVDAHVFFGLPESVDPRTLEQLVFLAVDLCHLRLLVGLELWLLERVLHGLPVEITHRKFSRWSVWLLYLNVAFDVVEHVGGELQEFFSFVLLVVDLDGGGVVGEAGHLEGA